MTKKLGISIVQHRSNHMCMPLEMPPGHYWKSLVGCIRAARSMDCLAEKQRDELGPTP